MHTFESFRRVFIMMNGIVAVRACTLSYERAHAPADGHERNKRKRRKIEKERKIGTGIISLFLSLVFFDDDDRTLTALRMRM